MNLKDALSSVEYFYRRIYWQAPTATTIETPDYAVSYSGVTWLHSINHLWVYDVDTLDDELLGVARRFFQPYHAEYSIVFTEPDSAKCAHWLSENHYFERSTNPIFVLDGLPRTLHAHREVKVELACADQQQVLLDILYGAFFMGPEIGRCAVRTDHFTDPSIRHYLAYVDGQAAACLTLLLNDGIAGVWNVGTLRPYRRQGIASALLMQALADAAADGFKSSVLVASPMGRPLYEELGYHLIGTSLFYGPGE